MPYEPKTRVLVDGVDLSTETLNSVAVSGGRNSVLEQCRAGVATVTIIDPFDIPPAYEIGQSLDVQLVTDTTVSPNTYASVFKGRISDIEHFLIDYGNLGSVVGHKLTAVGPLARLHMLPTAASYAKAKDGDFIAAVLADAFATEWDEVDASLTWDAVDSAKDWSHYDNSFAGTIDTPGTYEIKAYSGGIASAADLCTQIANSARGILWESDGFINYSDLNSVVTAYASSAVTLPLDAITTDGLQTTVTDGDLLNQLRLTYGSSAVKTAADAASIDLYGVQGGEWATMLHDATDAQTIANVMVATRARPRLNLGAVTLALHSGAMSEAEVAAYLPVYAGFPVRISGLPDGLGLTTFGGVVDSYSWRITDKEAYLTLQVSDIALLEIIQAWQQVQNTEAWNTLGGYDWLDAKVIV